MKQSLRSPALTDEEKKAAWERPIGTRGRYEMMEGAKKWKCGKCGRYTRRVALNAALLPGEESVCDNAEMHCVGEEGQRWRTYRFCRHCAGLMLSKFFLNTPSEELVKYLRGIKSIEEIEGSG